MTTRAIVFRAANEPTIEDLPLPDPRDDEVIVRVEYSGVSIGTEQSIFSGARTHNGTFPLVGGYMAAGVVERTVAGGPGVGERVICTGARLTGEVASVWGGHTSRQVARASSCLPVPGGVPMEQAAMYVMPGVGLNAVNLAGVQLTDQVVIQGQGLIGQLCGQWCRNRGARVVTIEPDPHRRELSRRHVTSDVIDPTSEDVPARVAELTGGGPTVVIEATASKRFIGDASRLLRPGGKMIFLSWYPGDITLDFAHFHNHQITAYFPTGAGGPEAARATLAALAAGTIHLADNLTDVYRFDQAPDGYRRIIDGDRSIMGMVVDWREA